jgi:hypothetical protein
MPPDTFGKKNKGDIFAETRKDPEALQSKGIPHQWINRICIWRTVSIETPRASRHLSVNGAGLSRYLSTLAGCRNALLPMSIPTALAKHPGAAHQVTSGAPRRLSEALIPLNPA